MARTKKAYQLRVGDWFGDPAREPYDDGPLRGRPRAAKVVKVLGTEGGRVFFVLDDETRWNSWTASYPADQELRLVA